MEPFRKNVAIAIDGGGIKGIIVTRALAMLEQELGQSVHDIFRLAAGTSTGAIIGAGIGIGITASAMFRLYLEMGPQVFQSTWRKTLWPLSHYRYSGDNLHALLVRYLGNHTMGDYWTADPRTDVVITTFDLVTNHTRFVKPYKEEYRSWPVVKAVQSSSTVPTYFPVVEGRYVDGGVGSYANPCYIAAYEAMYCLHWDPAETTLLSLGTGRDPHGFKPETANQLWAWQWINPLLGAFLQSADDQQINLVNTFFDTLDFRRFQVNLAQPIEMDDTSQIPLLTSYGEELGKMILSDQVDSVQYVTPEMPTEADPQPAQK